MKCNHYIDVYAQHVYILFGTFRIVIADIAIRSIYTSSDARTFLSIITDDFENRIKGLF